MKYLVTYKEKKRNCCPPSFYWVVQENIIVADSDSPTFFGSSQVNRHKRLPPWLASAVLIIHPGYDNGYALGVTKSRDITTGHNYETTEIRYPPEEKEPPEGEEPPGGRGRGN